MPCVCWDQQCEYQTWQWDELLLTQRQSVHWKERWFRSLFCFLDPLLRILHCWLDLVGRRVYHTWRATRDGTERSYRSIVPYVTLPRNATRPLAVFDIHNKCASIWIVLKHRCYAKMHCPFKRLILKFMGRCQHAGTANFVSPALSYHWRESSWNTHLYKWAEANAIWRFPNKRYYWSV